jgi:hypothetical protein
MIHNIDEIDSVACAVQIGDETKYYRRLWLKVDGRIIGDFVVFPTAGSLLEKQLAHEVEAREYAEGQRPTREIPA